jgi:hypothetical protein
VLGILLVVLAALLAAGGLAAWVGYGLARHTPVPDLAAYARSGAVRRADAQTAAWFDGELARLGREAPWLRAAGSSVLDECVAAASGSPDGPVGSWGVRCQRVQDSYYAFAGGGTRLPDLERTLGRMGWAGFTFTPGAAAAGGQPATPAVLEAGYNTQPGPAGKAGLRVSWLGPAQTHALRDYVGFAETRGDSNLSVIQAVPPNLRQIARVVTPPADNLIVVEQISMYAVRPAAS